MRRIGCLRESGAVIKASSARTESRSASAATVQPMGHPDFHDLQIGEVGTREAAAMFLDLRSFTARSFWDPPDQMIYVNVAVITELVESIQRHGGCGNPEVAVGVLGPRGPNPLPLSFRGYVPLREIRLRDVDGVGDFFGVPGAAFGGGPAGCPLVSGPVPGDGEDGGVQAGQGVIGAGGPVPASRWPPSFPPQSSLT